MSKYTNDYIQNEENVQTCFDALTNYDKGEFIAKNIKWIKYAKQYNLKDVINSDNVINYIADNVDMLDDIMNTFKYQIKQTEA